MKMYNINELTSSRIQYDKNPPRLMLWTIIVFVIGIIMIIVLSCFTYKTEVVRSTGVLSSANKNYIMSSTGGKVTNVYKNNNEFVNEGDLLFELDNIQVSSQITAYEAKAELLKEYVDNYQIFIDNLNDVDVNNVSNLVNPFKEGEMFLNYKNFITSLENFETEGKTEEEIAKERKNIVEQYLQQMYQGKFQYNYEYVGTKSQVEAYEEMLDSYKIYASSTGYINYNVDIKNGMVIGNDTLGTISERINKENALIEVYVPSQNKSFITVEDEVEIVIAGLSQQEYGKLNGKIINISSDVVTNEDGVFYRVSVKPNDISLFKNNNSIELINGQIGEVRIKYESVTWMNWALKKIGIIDR